MPILKMPDNTQVQFPDDMPAEQIRGLIAQKFPDVVHSSGAKDAADKVRAFASGANDAFLGLPNALAAGVRTLFNSKGYKENYQNIETETHDVAAANPKTALAGLGAGAVVTAPLAAAATPFRGALALQKGQKLANAARLAGQGAGAGAVFGAASGAVEGAAEGLPDGDASKIVTSAAREGTIGGVMGAVAGPLAGAAGAGVSAAARWVNRNTAGAIPASVRLLAKHLDEAPAQLYTMMREFRAATGRGLAIADIINAKSIANLAPYAGAKQSSRVIMQEGAENARTALPARLSNEVAETGQTATPFAAEPTLRTARAAPLEQLRDEQADAILRPLGPLGVTLTQAELNILDDPLLRVAFSQRANPRLAEKIGAAATRLGDPKNMADHSLTVDDMDSLRKYVKNQASSAYKESQGELAQQYDDLATRIEQVTAAQHPQYGEALETYSKQSQFIDAFNHAFSGKSADDASGALARQTFNSPEGIAGLEVGARSRVMSQAGAGEAAAQRIADSLRQGGDTAMAGQIPGGQLGNLQKIGAIETQSQKNRAILSGGRLPSAAEEATKKMVQGVETAVALGGHTTTGFGVHALTRSLTGMRVSKATADDLARKILQEKPDDVDAIIRLLDRANLSEANQNKILALMARHGGALAAQVRPNTGE